MGSVRSAVPPSPGVGAVVRTSAPALAFQSAAPAATPATSSAVALASGTRVTGVQGSNVTAGPLAAGTGAQPRATAAARAEPKTRARRRGEWLELRATGRGHPIGRGAARTRKAKLDRAKNVVVVEVCADLVRRPRPCGGRRDGHI